MYIQENTNGNICQYIHRDRSDTKIMTYIMNDGRIFLFSINYWFEIWEFVGATSIRSWDKKDEKNKKEKFKNCYLDQFFG